MHQRDQASEEVGSTSRRVSTPLEGKAANGEPSSTEGVTAAQREVTFDEVLRPSGRRHLRKLPSLIREAFRLVWEAAPRQLVLAGVLQAAAALSLAAQLLVARRVFLIAGDVGGLPDLGVIAPELLLFGLLLVIVAVTGQAQREQQTLLGELVSKHTTGYVVEVTTQVELIEFERPDFHDRLQRARVNATFRPTQIANGLIGALGSGAAVMALGAAVVWLEPLVIFVLLAGILPTLWLNRLSSRLVHGFEVRQTPIERRRGYLYQILTRREEAQEVRAFGSQDHLRSQHDRLYDRRITDLRWTLRRRMILGTLSGILAAAVTVGSLFLLLWFVRIGRVPLADAAVALGGVVMLSGRLRALVGSTGGLYEGSLFLQDFTDFVEECRRRAPKRSTEYPPVGFDVIQLDRVGFTYPSRSEQSLSDISLTLRGGEVIALVGENGSGKTTLTKLLAGLLRPTEGTIRWDGTDLEELDLAAVRENVTVIFQDFARYFLTAGENVAISRIQAAGDLPSIRSAARDAGIDDQLASLPDGYETLLGPAFSGGVDLSGGQWQRVALARAYFREAPLLILDEPTASLDPRGEYEIFQQVRRLARGRTVVLVSHRFSSVRAADRILVLDGGRIVEEGSHEALLKGQGLYHELFELQAQGYERSVG